CSIGSHPSNDLVLADRAVSRFHCEIVLGDGAALLRDLGSRNGTTLDGVVIKEAQLRHASTLMLGKTSIRFELHAEQNQLPLSEDSSFGSMIGASATMRAVFAVCARAAQGTVTVLIEGETGTGKEGCAESIHEASA